MVTEVLAGAGRIAKVGGMTTRIRGFSAIIGLGLVGITLAWRTGARREPTIPGPTDNEEVSSLSEVDQADRRPEVGKTIDPAVIVPRDREREESLPCRHDFAGRHPVPLLRSRRSVEAPRGRAWGHGRPPQRVGRTDAGGGPWSGNRDGQGVRGQEAVAERFEDHGLARTRPGHRSQGGKSQGHPRRRESHHGAVEKPGGGKKKCMGPGSTGY